LSLTASIAEVTELRHAIRSARVRGASTACTAWAQGPQTLLAELQLFDSSIEVSAVTMCIEED